MDKKVISVKTDFACVYLLNGVFSENATSFSYSLEEVLYITVLPLSAHLLPYTVKLLQGKVLENTNLCDSFIVDNNNFIKLKPRYSYMYSASNVDATSIESSVAEKLFNAVKQKDFETAKKCLSKNLLQTIDNQALEDFFVGYKSIIKDEFSNAMRQKHAQHYYLINDQNIGEAYSFDIKNDFIENIILM